MGSVLGFSCQAHEIPGSCEYISYIVKGSKYKK